jgi:hypothetical protein
MEDVHLPSKAGNADVSKSRIDLEWQSFPSSASTAHATASAPKQPSPTQTTTPAQSQSQVQLAEILANPMACISPAFYQQLFNVDTVDVVARLRNAAWPFTQTPFLGIVQGHPDLYGPTWICATLVFVIGAASNLNSWMNFAPAAGTTLWKYDFRLVTLALFTVFGFTFGAPMILYMLLNYLNVTALPLIILVCIYGYSVAVYIPATVSCTSQYCVSVAISHRYFWHPLLGDIYLCLALLQLVATLPSSALQWLVIVVSCLVSSVFVFKSIWPALREQAEQAAGRAVVLAVVLANVAFAIVLKTYFFSF